MVLKNALTARLSTRQANIPRQGTSNPAHPQTRNPRHGNASLRLEIAGATSTGDSQVTVEPRASGKFHLSMEAVGTPAL